MGRSVAIFDTFSILAGFISSVVWLLYNVAVLEKDRCMDLVITNVASYISSFAYLLAVCRRLKSTIKASLLIIFTAIFFGTIFILVQMDLEKTKILEAIFGTGGVLLASYTDPCGALLILNLSTGKFAYYIHRDIFWNHFHIGPNGFRKDQNSRSYIWYWRCFVS